MPVSKSKKKWKPLFCSDKFFDPDAKPTLADYKLKDRHLRLLGKEVSDARQEIRRKAVGVEEADMH